MDKIFRVKTIPLQYGDAQIRCHKIKQVKEVVAGSDLNYHSHKYYECHFVEKGTVKFRMADRDITLSQSEMLIIPPDVGHFAVVRNHSVESHVFEFSLCQVESKEKGIYKTFKELLEKAAVNPVKVSEELISVIREFKNMPFGNTISEYCFDVARLTNVIAIMFNEINTYNATKEEVFETIDWQTLLDLYINMPEKTLDDLAQATSYSRRQIIRIVYKLYGMSLTDLRNQSRIQTAKELLKKTEYTIDQIALDSGFKSTNAFRESFKNHENITPSEYRKREHRKEG